jgi:hypothetical protein
VLVDGRPLSTYARAYVQEGRVYAPLQPVVLRFADRAWFEGATLVIEHAGRRVRIRLGAGAADRLDATYVAIGPLLRQLGDGVRYLPRQHRLDVQVAPLRSVASPTPFTAQGAVPPRMIFTPTPVATPRPVWSGSPLPRRTPLPVPPPQLESVKAVAG